MRLYVLIALFFITVISCSKQSNSDTDSILQSDPQYLSLIEFKEEFRLVQTDDRFGEWGGNTFVIRIYKDSKSKLILADYQEFEGSMKPPHPPKSNERSTELFLESKPILVQKNNIRLTLNEKEIIEDAIIELVSHKRKSENEISHSGYYNSIISADSAVFLVDYPSIKWSYFQKLRKSIL